MNDDKYIGIEVLANSVNNMTEMINDRNALLNSMYKEDLYDDFLMSEAMQGGMGGAGIDNVVGQMGMMGPPDLSIPREPDNKEYINVEEAGSALSQVGGASKNPDTQPTQKYNQGGISSGGMGTSPKSSSSPFSPVDNPSTKSLAETGFDDTVEKNISNKLEDDFQIDSRLKNAFGSALALPVKAAAVGLMGLLNRMPVTSEEMGDNIKTSITEISSSMGLSNETNLNNVEESTTDIVSEGDTNNLVSWFSRMVGTKAESEGKPMGGNITKLHGIGKGVNQGGGGIGSTVRNFFGLARNKDHEVSDQTMMGGVVNHLQRNRRMIEMLGDSYTNTNINAPNQGGMTSIINNLGTSMGGFNPSNTFADITNTMTNNSGDISSSNNIGSVISDLTNNVLNESSLLTSEMNDTSALQTQMSNIVKGSLPSPNMDMESGGSMAISNIKISPFFTEYANTAQFT